MQWKCFALSNFGQTFRKRTESQFVGLFHCEVIKADLKEILTFVVEVSFIRRSQIKAVLKETVES